MQTGLPLPGAEDYILMISAHLDTVFCFTSSACTETIEPCGVQLKIAGMRFLFLPLALFHHGHMALYLIKTYLFL